MNGNELVSSNKSCKSLKLTRFKYHYLLNRNVTHDTYLSTLNLLKSEHKTENGSSIPYRSNMDMISKRDINLGLPYPLFQPHPIVNLSDPCTTLLKEKTTYNNRMSWCLKEYKNIKSDTNAESLQNVKALNVPRYLLDLSLGHIEDPDPYFSGDYNWYYTGNSLVSSEIDAKKYLIRPSSCQNIILSNLNDPNENLHSQLENRPIYAIDTIESSTDGLLNVRYKDGIDFLTFSIEDDSLKTTQLWSHHSTNAPIIDSKINISENAEIGVLDLDRELKIFDLNSDECVSYQIDRPDCDLSDKLMQFQYGSKKEIILMDRCNIYLLDKVSKNIQSIALKEGYFVCDDLCAIASSKADENYIFCATVHSVLKVDKRNQRVCRKWSHLLSHPPLMMKTYFDGSREYILFSSQNPNSRGLVIDDSFEVSVCKHIPSNFETVRLANLRKMSLHEDLNKRLALSTTGINILGDRQDLNLYFTNCAGDIFLSTLKKTSDEDKELPISKMSSWIDTLPVIPKKLKITALRDMTDARYCLRNMFKRHKLAKFTKENKKLEDFYKQVNMENFAMGHMWDEDASDRNSVDSGLETSMTSKNKVSQWLNTL